MNFESIFYSILLLLLTIACGIYFQHEKYNVPKDFQLYSLSTLLKKHRIIKANDTENFEPKCLDGSDYKFYYQ